MSNDLDAIRRDVTTLMLEESGDIAGRFSLLAVNIYDLCHEVERLRQALAATRDLPLDPAIDYGFYGQVVEMRRIAADALAASEAGAKEDRPLAHTLAALRAAMAEWGGAVDRYLAASAADAPAPPPAADEPAATGDVVAWNIDVTEDGRADVTVTGVQVKFAPPLPHESFKLTARVAVVPLADDPPATP